jgi:hypothetical protein
MAEHSQGKVIFMDSSAGGATHAVQSLAGLVATQDVPGNGAKK